MLGVYFSGTGNTKYCIDTYVHTFDNSAAILSIEDRDCIESIQKAETILLAYPIYYSNLPKILQDFLHENSSIWKDKNIFLLTTMGLFSGDGTGCAARILKTYGAHIIGGLQVKMPDCISDEKVLKKSLEKNQRIVQVAKKQCQKAAFAHKSGKPAQQGLSAFSHILGLFGQRLWFYRKTASYSTQLSIHTSSCVGCGLCVSLCPMKNLQIVDGKALSSDHCTMCYRCINHCPKQAITLLGNTIHEQSLLEKYLPKQE